MDKIFVKKKAPQARFFCEKTALQKMRCRQDLF